jgi:hypothetical protein
VTGEAQAVWGRFDQFDAGNVFSLLVAALDYADLVTGHAAHGDRAVYRRTLGLIYMTFNALCGISLGIEGNWVPRCTCGYNKKTACQYKHGYQHFRKTAHKPSNSSLYL